VAGDRYSYVPYWLLNACAARRWIYVTPDYRLIPEATAHDAVNDNVDAYTWATTSLARELGITDLGPILLSGSSAGGYLALTTGTALLSRPVTPPAALLLIFGVLEPADERYTTKGMNIWNRPPVDCAPTLAKVAEAQGSGTDPVLSGVPEGSAGEPWRQDLITAFHVEALFPDYMTGVSGLSAAMAREGPKAIPEAHRDLYVIAFEKCKGLPTTIILHGQNDSAVPFKQSELAAAGLERLGVKVQKEFPEDGEHGFDGRMGNVDVEKETTEEFATEKIECLRRVLRTFDEVVKTYQA
jgi:acetyl esterase/lipase